MARDPDHLASSFETEHTSGLLSGLLAEENVLDRAALWRIAWWGAASVGAVILAVYANQSSIESRREQAAAADLARQALQLQAGARESQNEARRLASAIETLNADRDRLYSRVTVLEQGLDSVTGAIARQSGPTAATQIVPSAAAPAQVQALKNTPAGAVAAPIAATSGPTATEKPAADVPAPDQALKSASSVGSGPPSAQPATPALPLVASKSIMGPPDPAAGKLIEPSKPTAPSAAADVVATVAPAAEPEPDSTPNAPPKVLAQRTEFGVDVGGANSISGLRALWLGLLKSRSNAPLTALQPIIVIREGSNGLGMQLRLVAGPLDDAAAAAKVCAVLTENDRPCETALFDGQRLAMKGDDPAAGGKTPGARPASHRRALPKRVTMVEEPPKRPADSSNFSTLFGRR